MTEDRVARGRRSPGYRRLRSLLILSIALIASISAAPAIGSSGGAGVAGKAGKGARPRPTAKSTRSANPFATRAMWIWELPGSNGGNVASIVATARQYKIQTLIIKAGDGSGVWSQFNAQTVAALHAQSLRVCAWQYVYGVNPLAEAHVGAQAVSNGADCLLIDAEGEYEGRYVQAQTYITELRNLIGPRFPVALAGFPYIDFHPAFPYSVFLGPGGAQYNVPQMYWKDIGTTVDDVYAHTYSFNRVYGRPISPLGQVYNSPPAHQVVRFRQLARAYGALGVSWWDWQESPRSKWIALSRPAGTAAHFAASPTVATMSKGAAGDIVVWAQEHLVSAGFRVTIDGGYGNGTVTAVEAFQTAHGLIPDGVLGPATWQTLLRYAPAAVVWTSKRGQRSATVASLQGKRLLRIPKSASMHAKRDEIPGSLGSGRPARH
jgi:Putative peptidoglycan binding domain